MIMLACLAIAGVALGIFFNSYALAAACIVFSLASFVSAIGAGLGSAGVSMISGLLILQSGYFVGLWLSGPLHAEKPAAFTTNRR